MKVITIALLFTIVLPAPIHASDTAELEVTKRYALIVGADNAGNQRPALKYSRSDAKAVKQLFHDIGGLKYSNSRLLLDPTIQDLTNAFSKISMQAKNGADDEVRSRP